MLRETFTLEFFGECPYQAGDEIGSPVVDGHGKRHEFAGEAHVVEITATDLGHDIPQYKVKVLHECHTEPVEMSEKPTTQDLILLEVRDLTASLGELRKSLSEMWRQSVRQQEQIGGLQEDVKNLRALSIDIDRPWAMTGSIQGLEGEFTVSPPPEWEA